MYIKLSNLFFGHLGGLNWGIVIKSGVQVEVQSWENDFGYFYMFLKLIFLVSNQL